MQPGYKVTADEEGGIENLNWEEKVGVGLWMDYKNCGMITLNH